MIWCIYLDCILDFNEDLFILFEIFLFDFEVIFEINCSILLLNWKLEFNWMSGFEWLNECILFILLIVFWNWWLVIWKISLCGISEED